MWARCAAGPVEEQLHIHEGEGFFWDGEEKTSVTARSFVQEVCEDCINYLLVFSCLCLALPGLLIQRGEPGCALSLRLGPRTLEKGLGRRKGTGEPLLPLSSPKPKFS